MRPPNRRQAWALAVKLTGFARQGGHTMKCMTDEDEHPEAETDESTERSPKTRPIPTVPSTEAGEHTAPPTEAIIIKSSD